MTEQEKQMLMKWFFSCFDFLSKEDAQKIKDILLNAALKELALHEDDCK